MQLQVAVCSVISMRDRLNALPRFDLALAAGTFCWALGDSVLGGFDRPALALIAAPLYTLPLALRRSYPLASFAVVLGGLGLRALAGQTGSDPPLLPLVLFVSIYSTGAWASGRRSFAGLFVALVVGASALAQDPSSSFTNLGDVLYFAGIMSLPWAAGYAVRRFRSGSAASVERAVEAERARASAVDDERRRIARELHDVVAHAMSVIVLQARGGRRVMDGDPGQARAALDTIESTSAQALEEMRRLLGMLREPGQDLTLAASPSLSNVDELVASVRMAGLPVEVTITGNPVELSPGVDLSAFRIVQEALTNALKHAGPAHANVEIRYHPTLLELEITDDGVSPGTPRTAGGHGLTGMRERVTIFGGHLESGPRPQGGYVLRAQLPLEAGR